MAETLQTLKKEEQKAQLQKSSDTDQEELVEIKSNWDQRIDAFDKLPISQKILQGIYGMGYQFPSDIQQLAIIPILNGKDIIAQACSGTGKTAAFGIPIVEKVDEGDFNCQAIILSPTRELAQQTFKVLSCFTEFTNVKVQQCIGGTNLVLDKKHLQEGAHIIVGTPGRLIQLMEKGWLKVEKLKTIVLDEADEMLSRGFSESIQKIFTFMPSDVQACLFSATMPKEILDITKEFMRDPVKILVEQTKISLDGIAQYYIAVDKEEWKTETLMELFKNLEIQQCIIFANTKERVIELEKKLKAENFVVSSIHAALTMDERDLRMKEFRTGSSRVLIASDLLSRGIDVQSVSLVINYDITTNKEKYIHRIGRTGRNGRKGLAINFVTPFDYKFLQQFQELYQFKIDELPVDVADLFGETQEKT